MRLWELRLEIARARVSGGASEEAIVRFKDDEGVIHTLEAVHVEDAGHVLLLGAGARP